MISLVPYLGGKARQQSWIASVIDATPHKTYIEPFCGTAAVFWVKKPTKIEILNDKDKRFSLIFKMLRHDQAEVLAFLKLIEYSKCAFDESYDLLRSGDSGLPDWKLGCWALFQIFASFSGYPDAHSFAWRVKGQNPAAAWQRKIRSLQRFRDRLCNATILNLDGIKLIKRADKPGVLLYVDPPYIGAEHRYKVAEGFKHEKLAEALRELKNAKVVLSHYYIEPYISLYEGWTIHKQKSVQSCAGSTKHSPDTHPKVIEALFCN
jgi:DNA adenine methylase